MCASRHLVVGVDGSVASERALRWALVHATRTGATVDIVAAWHWRPIYGTLIAATTAESVREWTERVVGEMVADARATHPGVPVTATLVEGDAADVLTHAALDGDLIVLGSHHHGRVHHAVLGSTIDACVGRAPCPVVVVPAALRDREAVWGCRVPGTAPLATSVVGIKPGRVAARLIPSRDVIAVAEPTQRTRRRRHVHDGPSAGGATSRPMPARRPTETRSTLA
jgi:nucleotide-binding universal stress UspA family protein